MELLARGLRKSIRVLSTEVGVGPRRLVYLARHPDVQDYEGTAGSDRAGHRVEAARHGDGAGLGRWVADVQGVHSRVRRDVAGTCVLLCVDLLCEVARRERAAAEEAALNSEPWWLLVWCGLSFGLGHRIILILQLWE